MKKIYSVILGCAMVASAGAQNFSDNFDSYTANAFLAQTNSAWKTWANKPGTTEDVRVTDAKAKSGSNALYFSSSAATGGPTDILLPFGGEYNTGTFSLNLWLFVDAQKKAYFNLQEKSVAGQAWSVDVNFDSLGQFNLVNTTAGTLLTGSYTPGAWNKITLNINLNTNTWDFLLNDVSKGSFQNTYRQIASMNIYAVQNSSFYVDDVSYAYTAYTPTALNAAVTLIDKVQGKLAGGKVVPEIEVKNLGTGAVTAVNLEVTYNGATLSKNVIGLNLAKNASTLVKMDGSFTLVAGSNIMKATLTGVNGASSDDNAGDNSKEISLNPVVPAAGKVVVAEEATGTWCTWCPRGAVFLRKMDEKYEKNFIGIAVHNNDPMMNVNYNGGLGSLINGYPSVVVDRGNDIDPSAMEADVVARLMVAPKGGIKSGATFNTTSRELKVSLTTKFNATVSGYKLAFVLVEDSVTGSGAGWDQVNAYAGGSRGEMGGFEKLPNPVPAALMVYDHVGRVIYPNFNGLNNAFGTSPNMGDSFTHNFMVGVDPSWKVEKLHIVGLLIDASGKIDNGSSTSLSDAIANGYVAGTAVTGLIGAPLLANGLVVYPNPSAGRFAMRGEAMSGASVLVTNMEGKVVYTGTSSDASHEIDGALWPSGVYIARISNADGVMVVKLVRE
ncbi:MAG: T9SS type A sorting domain-containing protein [bacterium]|nr:T9SS type A sorting domain-containing protein [bacterium]